MHPRHEIEKEYVADVGLAPDDASLEQLRRGIELEDGMTLAGTGGASVGAAAPPGHPRRTRTRQVRRMSMPSAVR